MTRADRVFYMALLITTVYRSAPPVEAVGMILFSAIVAVVYETALLLHERRRCVACHSKTMSVPCHMCGCEKPGGADD